MSHCLTYSILQQRRKYVEFFPTGEGCGLSLRKLIKDYTGYCIKVRRSSDDTEQDIGFTAENILDESALTTFVGAGDGFVSVWYDQFGNSNNATQTTGTNQPKIVYGGTVIKEGTKPIIDFGSNSNRYYFLFPSGFLYNTSEWSYIHVAKITEWTNSNAGIFATSDVGQKGLEILQHGTVAEKYFSAIRLNNDGDGPYGIRAFCTLENKYLWNNNQLCITSIFNGNTLLYAYNNQFNVCFSKNENASPLNYNGKYAIGMQASNYGTIYNMYGKISELVIYETNKLNINPALRTNINNFYNIY